MKLQGKNLSLQARRALNDAVLDWLTREVQEIGADGYLIGEVFSSLKSTYLVLLRKRLRAHLSQLRVFDKHLPSQCNVTRDCDLVGSDLDSGEWKRLSGPMIGAVMGQCHSTGIKAKQKAAQE